MPKQGKEKSCCELRGKCEEDGDGDGDGDGEAIGPAFKKTKTEEK